jgi:c-di-GMP-related signal transduction protein
VETFVARQAIFSRALDVWGYELLFRASAAHTEFDRSDGTSATARVIADSLLTIGLDKLLHGKKAFINFNRELLLSDWSQTALPTDRIIIEVLETVEPDAKVLNACKSLRALGYMLALDDFCGERNLEPLAELVDFIKIDLRKTPRDKQKELVRRYGDAGILMLAEKIETYEELEWAKDTGYHYFQGFFFARPVIMSGRQIPAAAHSTLRLFRELQRHDLDFRRIEELIRNDVSLSYKLLRYMNSPLFPFPGEVGSISQALVVLGETNIRKWLTLLAFASVKNGKPVELATQSMVRARFCETIGNQIGIDGESDAFLMGAFSLLSVLLGRPLEVILDELKLSPELTAPLLGRAPKNNPLAMIHRLVLAYEAGEWNSVLELTKQLKIPAGSAADAYVNAVQWADQIGGNQAGQPHGFN